MAPESDHFRHGGYVLPLATLYGPSVRTRTHARTHAQATPSTHHPMCLYLSKQLGARWCPSPGRAKKQTEKRPGVGTRKFDQNLCATRLKARALSCASSAIGANSNVSPSRRNGICRRQTCYAHPSGLHEAFLGRVAGLHADHLLYGKARLLTPDLQEVGVDC